jgi:alcohol dehydrogenase class IV
MASFDLLTPRKIVFGWGRIAELGELVVAQGRRAFVVFGSRTLEASGVRAEIESILGASGVEVVDAGTQSREPEVEDVDRTTRNLRQQGACASDVVVAVGGGSAIDLGKAVAALVVEDGDSVIDFLEGVGSGRQIEGMPLPFIAVPTTAGTGSEATKNSVVSSYDPLFKKSLRSERMVADTVLVDPRLSVSVPATTTAYTGMDAITQLIESYVSSRARPIPRALAIDGLALAASPDPGGELDAPAIVAAVRDGDCRPARERMAHAAMLSGMALANSGLGMAHGVAAALGVHCRVPHGIACAVMLPRAMRVNAAVARRDMARIGEVLSGRRTLSEAEASTAAIDRVEELCAAVSIPSRLRDLGVQREQIPAIVTSSRGNSMSGNPRELTDDELTDILEAML